jgi:uncharacterized protein YndB with AHSA1/START domain
MSDSKPIHVIVRQNFKVTAQRVFNAWFDPDKIGQWMFGPNLREEEVLHIQLDPREGGAFSFLVRRDGQEIDHIGRYLEIKWPHRLVFTWGIRQDASSSVVSVDIVATDEGCEVSLSHELDANWHSYAPKVKEAWKLMLQTLTKHA